MSEIVSEKFVIEGMTCVNCQRHINETLMAMEGVESAEVQYVKGFGQIRYRPGLVSHDTIIRTIEEMDYTVVKKGQPAGRKFHEAAAIIIIIMAVYMLLKHYGFLTYFNAFQTVEAGMGYGMIFLVGILTSVHCLAMCGGINLSQSIPAGAKATQAKTALIPGLLYNAGRVISYTVIGGLAGALGSVVSFTGAAKGVVQLAAGVFMILMRRESPSDGRSLRNRGQSTAATAGY